MTDGQASIHLVSEQIDYTDNSEWLKKEAYKIAKEKALRGAALV
jgi:hypothetical protein